VWRSLLRGLRGVSWHSAWASSPRDCEGDPSATCRDDGQLDARDRPRLTVCRRLLGNDPRADRHHGGRHQPGVRHPFEANVTAIRQLVDEVRLVSESELLDAIRLMMPDP
jgi:hypothetical protein